MWSLSSTAAQLLSATEPSAFPSRNLTSAPGSTVPSVSTKSTGRVREIVLSGQGRMIHSVPFEISGLGLTANSSLLDPICTTPLEVVLSASPGPLRYCASLPSAKPRHFTYTLRNCSGGIKVKKARHLVLVLASPAPRLGARPTVPDAGRPSSHPPVAL